MTRPFSLTPQAARRFVLGRQGLWPGRRWAGKAGAAQALRQAELVQMDPLNVVARSHDLVLHSRVADYAPGDLDALMYHDREFFDYGGAIFICPMEELACWRVVMRRKGDEPRWRDFAAANRTVVREVRSAVRQRGPLGSRDLEGQARVSNYRGRKDTGLALYYLWLTGELMTHHRQNFERRYDLRDRIAPPDLNHVARTGEADRRLVLKQIAFLGLCPERAFGGMLERRLSRDEAGRWRDSLLSDGAIVPVSVEGQAQSYYALAADAPWLSAVSDGQPPLDWTPLGPTTQDEVSFLAPLDIVSARGRARMLFGFDYIWEVYKPAARRRWGYYTLPILYGDQLVARLDPLFDRERGTLVVKGFWLEDAPTGRDPGFADALGRGLARLMRFLKAGRLDAAAIQPARLRRHVQKTACL